MPSNLVKFSVVMNSSSNEFVGSPSQDRLAKSWSNFIIEWRTFFCQANVATHAPRAHEVGAFTDCTPVSRTYISPKMLPNKIRPEPASNGGISMCSPLLIAIIFLIHLHVLHQTTVKVLLLKLTQDIIIEPTTQKSSQLILQN